MAEDAQQDLIGQIRHSHRASKICLMPTCGGEAVTPLSQDLHEVVCEVSASQVQPEDGMGQGITFIDGHCVGDTITRVHDDTSGTTRGVQGQHSLDGHIHGRSVEGLKHDLEDRRRDESGSLCEQDRVLFGGNSQLVVEVYQFMKKLYLMSGTSNNGGEHSTWSIIPCKASFAHTGSVVNNEGGDFVIHFLDREEG
ncbi:hypothetical protein FQN60_012377 [Etheostoma spectabile]|uniref:Uncharacterized protein n=1 Tax=Etheostoma spectabile TaxID=54343 RepID=A0A5J5DPQ9_9PERO|nr:hypothetical protein FQN60_012377 [Etheostoma spectabile]